MDQKLEGKSSWWDYKRMIIFGIFLLIVWGSLWMLFYLKADEVTKDPCAVCAIKMGTSVSCQTHKGGSMALTRTYYPNGSFYENRDEVISIIMNMSQEPDRGLYNNYSNMNFTF